MNALKASCLGIDCVSLQVVVQLVTDTGCQPTRHGKTKNGLRGVGVSKVKGTSSISDLK